MSVQSCEFGESVPERRGQPWRRLSPGVRLVLWGVDRRLASEERS